MSEAKCHPHVIWGSPKSKQGYILIIHKFKVDSKFDKENVKFTMIMLIENSCYSSEIFPGLTGRGSNMV